MVSTLGRRKSGSGFPADINLATLAVTAPTPAPEQQGRAAFSMIESGAWFLYTRRNIERGVVRETSDNRPSILFWVIAAVLLLWGLGGASIYVAYFVETPAEFAAGAETAANQEAYAEYVANVPWWAIAVGIIAAVTRLLGAIGLLLRRAWALPLYVVSLIFFLVALYRAFFLANVASVMSGGHIATELFFLALSIFAIWFAHANKSKGILR